MNLWLRTGKAGATTAPQPQSTAALGTPNLAPLPPPPESAVNIYELTFGTVCGICAGIFVKKGAKTLATVFGGIFVLLQVSGAALRDAVSEVRSKTPLSLSLYKLVSWQRINSQSRLVQGRFSLRRIVLYFGR